jgi:hypothetical protein
VHVTTRQRDVAQEQGRRTKAQGGPQPGYERRFGEHDADIEPGVETMVLGRWFNLVCSA